MDLEGSKMLSVVTLLDVNGKPLVKTDLPGELKVGDPLALRFNLKRVNGGREEVLLVEGDFQVETIRWDATSVPHKQLLSVVSLGKPPTWRSVKKRSSERRLGPARNPPQSI